MRRLDLPCDRSHRDLLTKDLDSSGKIEGFKQTSSSVPSFKRSGGWGWGGDRPSHVTPRGNVTWGRARDRTGGGWEASARGSHVIGNQWECKEVGGEGGPRAPAETFSGRAPWKIRFGKQHLTQVRERCWLRLQEGKVEVQPERCT